MNKSKDKIMKEFLENNAYFVDFFNAYFFDGERVLKPVVLRQEKGLIK